MGAKSPQEWWSRFQRAMGNGDLDAVLALYEPGAVFAARSGELLVGHAALRKEFAPLAEARADFRFEIEKIIACDDLALLHSAVRRTRPHPTVEHALEVLRRQTNGDWLLAIGDPFTVGQR